MRKRSVLIVLLILALGLVGTGLSTFYQQNEQNITGRPLFTHKVSYGFPLGWYGYSEVIDFWPPSTKDYWFSWESLLLDAVFWTVISTLGYFAIAISIDVLHKARASKNLSVINI